MWCAYILQRISLKTLTHGKNQIKQEKEEAKNYGGRSGGGGGHGFHFPFLVRTP